MSKASDFEKKNGFLGQNLKCLSSMSKASDFEKKNGFLGQNLKCLSSPSQTKNSRLRLINFSSFTASKQLFNRLFCMKGL